MGLKWVKFGNLLKFSKRVTKFPSKPVIDTRNPVFSRGSGVLNTIIFSDSFMRNSEIKGQ